MNKKSLFKCNIVVFLKSYLKIWLNFILTPVTPFISLPPLKWIVNNVYTDEYIRKIGVEK